MRRLLTVGVYGMAGAIAPLLTVALAIWAMKQYVWVNFDDSFQESWYYYLPIVVPSSLAFAFVKWRDNEPSDFFHLAVAMILASTSSVVYWLSMSVIAMNARFDPRALFPFWVSIVGLLQFGLNYHTIRAFGSTRPSSLVRSSN